jgi:hypothetical protein
MITSTQAQFISSLNRKQAIRMYNRLYFRIADAMGVSIFDQPTAVACGHKNLLECMFAAGRVANKLKGE